MPVMEGGSAPLCSAGAAVLCPTPCLTAPLLSPHQYEQAADAELAWVAETKRKLMALGAIRLEQDQTTAQLQVQKVRRSEPGWGGSGWFGPERLRAPRETQRLSFVSNSKSEGCRFRQMKRWVSEGEILEVLRVPDGRSHTSKWGMCRRPAMLCPPWQAVPYRNAPTD